MAVTYSTSVYQDYQMEHEGYFGASSIVNDTYLREESLKKNVPYVVILFLELIVGVPANVSLIYLVARVRELRTVPNLLLANLAVGDLLFLLVSVPLSISRTLGTYRSGFNFCRFQNGVYYVSFAVSALSLTLISIERFGAIVKPFTLGQTVREGRSTVKICVLIWVISILVFGIYPVHDTMRWYNDCTMPYHSTKFKTFYALQLIILYVIPVFCMTIFYAFCTRELLRKRRILGKRSTGRGSSDRSRMRVAFNLMLITFLFTTCWLPNYIYNTWFLFVNDIDTFNSPVFMNLRLVKSMFYFLASCINPIVLYAMSSSFRHHLISIITCTTKAAGRHRNRGVARDTRSVTLKSTFRMQEPSTSNSVM